MKRCGTCQRMYGLGGDIKYVGQCMINNKFIKTIEATWGVNCELWIPINQIDGWGLIRRGIITQAEIDEEGGFGSYDFLKDYESKKEPDKNSREWFLQKVKEINFDDLNILQLDKILQINNQHYGIE